MKTSAKGIELIKKWEELRLTAYLCPAGVWTIGWGHTKNVYRGMKITPARAEMLLHGDIEDAEKEVNALNVSLGQNQYDALISFVFNLGGVKFRRSTLRKKILANPNDPSIGNEIKRWKYAKNPKTGIMEVLTGLVRRRADESTLYFA